MKKITFLLICCLFTLFLTAFEGLQFERPIGTWYCEDLGITIDFTNENFFEGTIVIDEATKEALCFLSRGGHCEICYKPENYPIEDGIFISNNGKKYYMSSRDYHENGIDDSCEIVYLYKGNLKYIGGSLGGYENAGRGMVFSASIQINGGYWYHKGDYTFERVYSEGESKDVIRDPVLMLFGMIILHYIIPVGAIITLVILVEKKIIKLPWRGE